MVFYGTISVKSLMPFMRRSVVCPLVFDARSKHLIAPPMINAVKKTFIIQIFVFQILDCSLNVCDVKAQETYDEAGAFQCFREKHTSLSRPASSIRSLSLSLCFSTWTHFNPIRCTEPLSFTVKVNRLEGPFFFVSLCVPFLLINRRNDRSHHHPQPCWFGPLCKKCFFQIWFA